MEQGKKRINITITEDLFKNLKSLAKSQKISVPHAIRELLKMAIESNEDRYFLKVGEERLVERKEKRTSHKDIWKK